MTEVELLTGSIAAGGEAVAREADGRVVFVRGALPGERVLARLTDEKSSFARAELTRVLEPAPERVTPPCPHLPRGCGGCDWQHILPAAQQRFRREIVVDALTRIGGIAEPLVELAAELAQTGYRTTVRCLVVDGQAAYRRRSSHSAVEIDSCLVAHPLIEELIAEGRFGQAEEVTMRVGARTRERLIIAHPTADGVAVPADVMVVGTDELRSGRRAWFHEQVAGRTWRISATSFFQDRPDGAEALVAAAQELVEQFAADAQRVVDLCAGVGVFAGTIGRGRAVVAVERHAAAVADARHNLASERAKVVRSSFERWRPSAAEVVVADPARSGLGKQGVRAVVETGASLLALVSCDPAALGRDARLLSAAGYRSTGSTIVDLFPQTSHVETMTGFVR